MKKPKTFYIRTYGCQMNELDSEVMIGMLKKRGLTRVDTEEAADLLLYNTCSVRDLSERKVMGKLGILGRRSRHRNKIIGVAGCMANNKKETLFEKVPHLDFVLGTNNIHELNQVLDKVIGEEDKAIRADERFHHELDYLDAERKDPLKAYVSIIRGCDKFCTYCIVPYTRGKEVSRDPHHIFEECQQLIDKGYQEITLLGQNVNSYGKDCPEWNTRFHDLLAKLDTIQGLKRVRFMTSHPCDITQELMEAVRDLPSLCELVHFPMQAGSSRILKKMHRIYTIEEYLEKVERFRAIAPRVKIGTDIIVGFPSETDEEFQMTYDLMEKLRFSLAFIFAYSPRKGTPSTRWKDDIPESVKQERLQRLMQLQENIGNEEKEGMLKSIQEVLVEKQNERDPTQLKGLTRCWKKVLFKGDKALVGTLQPVRLTHFTHNTFFGEIASRP